MRGMTLLELMVVVAMVGVLATMAIGISSKTSEVQNNNASARRVAHSLWEVRNWAHNTSRCIKVEVNAEGFAAIPYSTCEPALSGELSADIREFTFPSVLHSFAFDTTSGALVFNAHGGTTETTISTFSFVNESTSRTHRLRVYPAIGSIRDDTF